jgi:aspartate aminotransferase-like enzyme
MDGRMTANFLTGPVEPNTRVRAAFAGAPLSHRAPAFAALLARTRASLRRLTNASHAVVMLGSGTLANDAVAAQLRAEGGSGLVLANGEFGERLVDHARRFGLEFATETCGWGEPFDWPRVRLIAAHLQPAWIWAVLSETSTGMLNPLDELRAIAASAGASLCIDAISAIGLVDVDLAGVRFATAVSGKGLASYPGLSMVLHDGHLARPDRIPRYLDLASYEAANGVPFTHSSNQVAALDAALSGVDWPRKFARVITQSRALRTGLARAGLACVTHDRNECPGILTVVAPHDVATGDIARMLERHGVEVAWKSDYLRQRNWLQVCLMGDIDPDAVESLPAILAHAVSEASIARPQRRLFATD